MQSRATPDQISQAFKAIQDFTNDRRRPQFPGLPRASVARGLRERVQDPKKLDQDHASLCGPAAFLFCLLNCRPEVFVKYVCDLYNIGEARIGDLHVKPSVGCRHYSSDRNQIDDVDWIALASLRDSENIAMSYSSPDDEVSGATMPHTLAKWFEKAKFRNVHNETNAFFSKGLPTLESASHRIALSQFVCLFINMDMLDSIKFKHHSHFPDHWVVLDGALKSEKDDDVQFCVYSWGDRHPVPPPGPRGRMSRSDLSGNFYGFVAATPA
jgi:mannose-6-phosphate isomerase-like protein (cupin superfamily)